MALVLASKSPRRRQLLALLTPHFAVDQAAVDEGAVAGKTPRQLAQTLAALKAQAVFEKRPDDAIIGCDTVVELAGKTLGKPKNQAQAVAMLTALAGKTHLVHTGVCICVPGQSGPAALFCETTAVQFAEISPEEIKAYTNTPEPYDKAGGYGIQGAAAKYIPRIEGCYYNVMGLPLAALHRHMRRLGL